MPPCAIALDLERGSEFGAQVVTACLRQHVQDIRQWWTGKLILYTNCNYLDHYIADIFGLDIWISWPADAAGHYNPINDPPLEAWVMYQRSYTQAIPGHPDQTVDLDEFNGDEIQMREYFGGAEPPPEPGDNMAILDILADAKARQLEALAKIDEAIALAQEPQPPEPPEPPIPPPADMATYRVTQDKAIACFSSKSNDAGYPIMIQIPQEERDGQPFKNLNGQTVRVYRARVNADGLVDYYRIYGTVRVGTGQALYLSKADGGLID